MRSELSCSGRCYRPLCVVLVLRFRLYPGCALPPCRSLCAPTLPALRAQLKMLYVMQFNSRVGLCVLLPPAGAQRVRLQCLHWALAAPAPRLSSPSVRQAVARRTHSLSRDRMFSPRSCCCYTYGRSGLYWVMRTYWSEVTPSPCCIGCWPPSATPGRAMLGGGGGNPHVRQAWPGLPG